LERAETVRTQGTPVMIQGSAQRWFAPGFMDREPEFSSRLLHSLRDADRFSYAYCCEALAGFDVRSQLGAITVPTQVIAGALDGVATPDMAAEVATGITAGGGTATAVTVEGISHLAPAEAPAHTADLMRSLMAWAESREAAK
jgi:pimeloyl-ACP methyl ester carboxylesterase